jgi:hypothetical protein
MLLSEFIAGLQLLVPHYADRDGYHLSAEHDVVYLYPTSTPLPADEVAQMIDDRGGAF